ncbi:MAG: hypothetical protein MUE60_13255, partial [Candidatus Eisenbacteria bacterium]|nr:hypothetical protein [Candidatus Eisenbacteria bacterium]
MSRHRARRLRAATAALAVATALGVGASCGGRGQPGRDAGIITLLDLIPDSVAAGPWDLLAVRDYGRDPARRPNESSGLSEEVSLNPGRTVLVRLTYSKRWGRGGIVEARLVSAGRAVTAISGPLGKSWCELRLHNPSLFSGTLEILHSGVTGEAPLQSMVVLESRRGASPAEERRAHALLSWAGRAPRPEARAVLSRRKFGLMRGGFLRSALALAGADTISFELPPRTGRVRLRCWVAGLRVMEGGRPLLRAEVLDERGWSLIHRWDRVDLHGSAWRQTDTDAWITPHAQRLRFVTTGDEDVLALGSP